MRSQAQTVKPELKNVKAAQRPDSFYVDITYDLVAPDGVQAVVIVEASADNGPKYDVPISTLTGDFGIVKTGLGKRIVWNAWNDWPGKQTSAARVRLSADGQIVPTTPAPRANLVWIPPGAFTMGSPANEKNRGGDEGPQTQVWISRGFWMNQYEVTQGEYREIMGANPSSFTGNDRLPVENVTWTQAVDYCAKFTTREQNAGRLPTGSVYRLPTEAEWEYACRAGTTTRFGFGDDSENDLFNLLRAFAWFDLNAGGKTHLVGEKAPNRWGLFDMHGNVWEWCGDWHGEYQGGSVSDPKGASSGSFRVIRGGGWSDTGGNSRSAKRNNNSPSNQNNNLGFRALLAPAQPGAESNFRLTRHPSCPAASPTAWQRRKVRTV